MPSISDQQAWLALIEWNIKTKSRIVESDFTEAAERKLLNLGHTIGHALESWSHDANKPVAHGHAIAWGLVIETQLAIDVSPNQEETKALQESPRRAASLRDHPLLSSSSTSHSENSIVCG